MQIPNVNLESIPEQATRQLIGQLLNFIEALVAENATLHVENQQLRDELARLKGASPRPEIKPPVPPASTDHSSEAERQPRTPRGKPKQAKNTTLTVTREQRCVVDPATLPPDATRSGTTENIVQELVLVPEVIRFVREIWFVPSTGQTITAPLPEGYHGGFGPHLRAIVWTLGHGAHVSPPALLSFLTDLGRDIGAGTLARWLADEHGLCWVHDGRHDATLSPIVPLHRQLLADFRRDYWALSRELVAYREAPTPAERARLAAAFDLLVARRTGYDDLDARIARTAANRTLLLAVLDNPALPLHNNAMALAARRRVRKRDVSVGPQSRAGARAWDSFQTLVATAAKLGVRLYHYFRDRLLHPDTTPSLAERIRARSAPVALNPS